MSINRYKDVQDWLHLSPRSSLDFYCPYCGNILTTWSIGTTCHIPLITDGDIVGGVAEAIGWDENKPWDFDLCSTTPCTSCGETGFVVCSRLLAKHYSHESRLLLNAYPGEEEYFKCLIDPYKIIEKHPHDRMHHWKDYAGPNDGCWSLVEYKTDTLHPMQWHILGPFRGDIDNIQGPYGVMCCQSGDTSEWRRAKRVLIELWDAFQALAEIRQQHWENSSLKSI